MQLLSGGLVQTWFKKEDGKLVFKRSQDCAPIIEQCAELRATGNVGSSEMRWAGRIPKTEVEKYLTANGVTFADFCADETHVKRYLNDPDHQLLRIWTGRL